MSSSKNDSGSWGIFDSSSLVIPRAQSGASPIVVSLEFLADVDKMIPDVERSTPLTVSRHMVQFNLAISRISDVIAKVEYESRQAKRELSVARSIALLDRSASVISDRGLKATESTREAAVNIDPDVQAIGQRCDFLDSTLNFLKNKKDSVEMAYYAAKKICDLSISGPGGAIIGGGSEV